MSSIKYDAESLMRAFVPEGMAVCISKQRGLNSWDVMIKESWYSTEYLYQSCGIRKELSDALLDCWTGLGYTL